jgi:GNAT superfamily N-acetyltransferase
VTRTHTISLARPEHLSSLPAIELAAAALLRGHAPESLLAETTRIADFIAAQRRGHLWIALAGTEPVGFAAVRELEAGHIHLEEVDVHPASGRRGIGTHLVLTVCEWAAGEGYASVTLTTFCDVPWNMPFYARLGFQVIPSAGLSSALACVASDEARRGLERRVVMRRRTGVRVSDHGSPEDLRFLEEQINAHNVTTTAIRDARDLSIVLRDSTGRIEAGISGHTWGEAAEVRFLWVDEPRRRTGIGGRLLHAAEEEARARGCRKVVLSTHSFQAPDFYRKHGYVIAGEVADYPRGHRHLLLEKSLAPRAQLA